MIENIKKNKNNVKEKIAEARKLMSSCGGAIREPEKLKKALETTTLNLNEFEMAVGADSNGGIANAFRLRDTLISQTVYLSAMYDYAVKFRTRGSALYYDKNGSLREKLDECFRFSSDNGENNQTIQETAYNDGSCTVSYRPIRPLPEGGGFFENVWKSYRENGNVY